MGSKILYFLLKPIAKLLIKFKFRIEIIGLENLPYNQAIIIAANHVSNYDPLLLACLFKRKIHFLAKAELFRSRFLRWFFTSVHVIPVDRQSGIVIRPVRQSLTILKRGEILGVFPEGKRCKKGEVVHPKKGVAFFACKTNVPILPIALIGIKSGYRIPVRIVIGSQIIPTPYHQSDYTTLSSTVMNQIRHLERKYSLAN